MLIFRRSVSIFLAVIGTITLVLALVTRVAYAAVFDTNTYVDTVSEVVSLSEMRKEVSTFMTDSIVEGVKLDSPSLTYALRRARINPDNFRDDVRSMITTSVDTFMQSEKFMTLWKNTNKMAHENLMTIVKSDSEVTNNFNVDATELVTSLASSITDPAGKITKFIPLKEFMPQDQKFDFKLMDAKAVNNLRDGIDAASKIKWAFFFGSIILLLLSWLAWGRTRGAHRVIAISIASAGIITLIAKSSGSSAVSNAVDDKAQEAAKAIYSVITSPLTGYAVAFIILGLAGMGATFYRRSSDNQASGSL